MVTFCHSLGARGYGRRVPAFHRITKTGIQAVVTATRAGSNTCYLAYPLLTLGSGLWKGEGWIEFQLPSVT